MADVSDLKDRIAQFRRMLFDMACSAPKSPNEAWRKKYDELDADLERLLKAYKNRPKGELD